MRGTTLRIIPKKPLRTGTETRTRAHSAKPFEHSNFLVERQEKGCATRSVIRTSATQSASSPIESLQRAANCLPFSSVSHRSYPTGRHLGNPLLRAFCGEKVGEASSPSSAETAFASFIGTVETVPCLRLTFESPEPQATFLDGSGRSPQVDATFPSPAALPHRDTGRGRTGGALCHTASWRTSARTLRRPGCNRRTWP